MEVYKWMEQIQFVNGYNRGALYDLSRREHHLVPNEIDFLIKKIDGKADEFRIKKEEKEWLNFLIENEFVFKIPKTHHKNFSKINFNWDNPGFITNCIIEKSNYIEKTLNLIDGLICKHIVFLCYSFCDINKVLSVDFSAYNFQSIGIYAEFNTDDVKLKDFSNKIKHNDYIDGVYFQSEISKKDIPSKTFSVKWNKAFSFVINIDVFSEALKYNTYYNRKLFVGRKGELSNIFRGKSFANVSELNSSDHLYQIVQNPEFQKYWFVSPDMIDVVKDSEFRYMSVDSRIPHQRKDGTWYYMEEPSYNPYISKWKGEEGYLTLEECGVVSNEDGYKRDDEKIKLINEQLWN